MKIRFFIMILSLVVVSFSFSTVQEFTKPREKRFYPSCQQCVELEAEIVDVANKVLAKLIDLQKYVVEEQRDCLSMINGYIDGDKECLLQKSSKHERADFYQKSLTTKKKLETFLQQFNNSFDLLNI